MCSLRRMDGRYERMNTGIYEDYRDGILDESEYLAMRKHYSEEADRLRLEEPCNLADRFCSLPVVYDDRYTGGKYVTGYGGGDRTVPDRRTAVRKERRKITFVTTGRDHTLPVLFSRCGRNGSDGASRINCFGVMPYFFLNSR